MENEKYGMLKAVFKDVAGMPVRLPKEMYKEGIEEGGASKDEVCLTTGIIAGFQVLLGVAGFAVSGVGLGILFTYAASVGLATLVASMDEDLKKDIWPNLTKYREDNSPANDSPDTPQP